MKTIAALFSIIILLSSCSSTQKYTTYKKGKKYHNSSKQANKSAKHGHRNVPMCVFTY